MKSKLSKSLLQKEAKIFAERESLRNDSDLYGITDGKAIGTYLEHKFQNFLLTQYEYAKGSSAKGIDFPDLLVDMKVTSIKKPQSSCPFQSARQKIFGLGYSLLIFVYEKTDDEPNKTGCLNIKHTIFVEENRTADFQMTSSLLKIIENQGNTDDIVAYFSERFLPVDDIQAQLLAEEVVSNPPQIGYLTISNALQWRLQYRRIIHQADLIEGIKRLL